MAHKVWITSTPSVREPIPLVFVLASKSLLAFKLHFESL
jgi:hypothetical protein